MAPTFRIANALDFALMVALVSGIATDASAVTINWSPVGNPSNAADPADGDINAPGVQNFGAVAYNYRIGTYDVTNSQYAEFLNTKDPTGANMLGLYNGNMAGFYGGINFNAAGANGLKYNLVSGVQNHPVNNVTWYDTLRFANWMNNGQGNGDTETGAYTLLHDGSPMPTPTPSNGLSITRDPGATVFLPSENEWYKAAYYNPGTSSYFQFPTSSDTAPIASGPTALANHANYNSGGIPSDVGAYMGTTSPSGAFDMGGNVFQWNESLISGSQRGARGGSFDGDASYLLSSLRGSILPSSENNLVGFRVATITVPEPSTGVLAVVGFAGFVAWIRRRHLRGVALARRGRRRARAAVSEFGIIDPCGGTNSAV